MSGSTEPDVARYLPAVQRLARTLRASRQASRIVEIDDMVQEGVLAYLRAYPKATTDYPHAYAMKAAHWAIIDLLHPRVHTTHKVYAPAEVHFPPPASASEKRNWKFRKRSFPESPASEFELQGSRERPLRITRKVRRAIRSLRRPYRDVLQAVYLQYIPLAEYAATTKQTYNTVYGQQKRGLEKLQAKLVGA